MSSKRRSAKKSRSPARSAPPVSRAVEDRTSLVLTVAWMQATLMALVCQLAAVVGAWATRRWPDLPQIEALTRLLGFGAFVLGLVTLGLTWAAFRWRETPPPRPITFFALAVGVAPVLGAVFQWVSG